MALTWYELETREPTEERPYDHEEWVATGEVTHEGMVIGTFVREDRVMSDVYADCHYAQVWDPETETVQDIRIGCAFELSTVKAETIVDCAPEYRERKAELDAEEDERRAAADKRRRQDAHRDAARAEHDKVVWGKRMRVVRGRKVRIGTEGKVFWVKGGRCGLALSDKKDVHGRNKDVAWVDCNYLENVILFEYQMPLELA